MRPSFPRNRSWNVLALRDRTHRRVLEQRSGRRAVKALVALTALFALFGVVTERFGDLPLISGVVASVFGGLLLSSLPAERK